LAVVPSGRVLVEERRKTQRTPAERLHSRAVRPANARRRGGLTMESRQFDRWTRLFDGTSRRDAITLLAAGISGGLLATSGSRGVMAQVSGERCKDKGDNCNKTSDCCNNLRCKNGTCKKDNNNNNNNNCKGKGKSCNKTKDCCNNLRCKNGTCKKDSNNNNNNCKKKGDNCKNNNDCCNNLKCSNNNTCK
jgi:hypothetical protein